MSPRARACLPIASALLLGGCGQAVIKPAGAQRSVADVVSRQTGFRPTDVRCPSGVDAKVGGSFDCHFTGPEPKPYVAHVRIISVRGPRVEFYITTVPQRPS